jgi:hypothetical protein
MRFREDWLADVVRIPYVPTLGPVHPQADLPELFEAVVSVAGTGEFLPYDKDRRWFAVKSEQVIAASSASGSRQGMTTGRCWSPLMGTGSLARSGRCR